MLSWKIGPTLACGNTIMLKTAEQTPLSAFYVANLLQETGLPEGILNIISGFATTADAPLRSHMDMDKVLNAGKNKLKSMDEVGGLVNLRALILNGELLYMFHLFIDQSSVSAGSLFLILAYFLLSMIDNDIVSICKLDNMKEFNTLVMDSYFSNFIFSLEWLVCN
ncbi:hypothetical protein P3S68_014603 [Capsicum galapagoense]